VVTREEVRQRFWADNTFVEFDNSLGVAIRKVRESLGDDTEAPCHVETIPRRGYRFLAPVTLLESARTLDPAIQAETGGVASAERSLADGAVVRSHPQREYWIVVALVLLVVGGAVYGFRSATHNAAMKARAASAGTPVHVRRSVAILGFRNCPGVRRKFGSPPLSARCSIPNLPPGVTSAWFRAKMLPEPRASSLSLTKTPWPNPP